MIITTHKYKTQLISAQEALLKLTKGNERFSSHQQKYPNQCAIRREESLNTQNPFAVILCCSDSRVIPEIIFDQGIGDLFVIRVAGNIINDDILGSIEFSCKTLNTKLIMVLGHQNCGSIIAAINSKEETGHLKSVINAVKPAIKKAEKLPGELIDNAIRENIKLVSNQISSSLNTIIKEQDLRVVGAYYNFETSKVTIIDNEN